MAADGDVVAAEHAEDVIAAVDGGIAVSGDVASAVSVAEVDQVH